MKKILIEGMSSNLGGMETFIHLLFEVLRDEWQLDFLVYDESIPYQSEFLDAGCHIYWVTPRSKNMKKSHQDIDCLFENGHYDTFWFNKTTLSNIYSLKSAKKHNVRNIICHSHSSKNMGSSLTALMHFINRTKINRYANIKVACSEVAADYFFGKNKQDVKYFANAVDISKYEPKMEMRTEIRNKLGVDGKFVVGHVARFTPEKNHAFLVDIFEEISKRVDAHLLLCGSGPLMNEIKEKVHTKGLDKNVSFLGMRKDIPTVLQAMDVFVMPSLFEGLPFSLVEAQAAGLPCIVADTVSEESKLTDILEFESLNTDVNLWADKILKYKDYAKVSKRNQIEEKGFSLESLAKQINEIIK